MLSFIDRGSAAPSIRRASIYEAKAREMQVRGCQQAHQEYQFSIIFTNIGRDTDYFPSVIREIILVGARLLLVLRFRVLVVYARRFPLITAFCLV